MATTVDKGLLLLRALAAEETGNGAPVANARLAERVGLDQAQVSRMLNALTAAGLVERETDSRGYRIGPELFGIGGAAVHADALAKVRPVLRGLLHAWREPAWLSMLSRGQVLTIQAEPSQWFPYFPVRVGALTPTWCSGPGRALTQDFSRDELTTLLQNEIFVGGGPGAVRDPSELFERNLESAKQVAVVADSEFEHDVIEFSAPVRCSRLDMTVAVSVAVPKHRVTGRSTAIATSVAEAARLVTSILSTASPAVPTGDRPVP
ncbi:MULTISPECIES: IclR family transcriptional regulator [unclassified Mycolicibacterium]|uniref:IclR family transcriptional regulator n=1 Tax=unclassified Mycolicibacterium TaxID=2636767 RepID=UPI00130670F4|nr:MULTISPECIES: helix-turn-helix domain-containing protein [unclassified Mycolicibacterium]MUL81637.1 helix-turn-helix domain-containing protein [Mycolicibacterium sp. CBMA 329]MUL87403.1 helix-turn-helix domain-containing protein [Mycolicibacterium sp. CBMA 331]MUL99731.1 helix-turn-helix domain-containing protein [Mycolicibacterium sp. CBMA 334]MUM25359.1 helix-turn-helix domain-containing protein [Mycolicibacterium sp. CBMA 295]MUM37700.1 helix-turn-helix domain-containing protein [Mycolic